MEEYKVLMDGSRNPLRALPPAQRMQVMVMLSVMWTTIFCASTSAWLLYGELVVGHVLAIMGVAITALIFRRAGASARSKTATYRDQPKTDGTARYDDVWGG